MDAYAEAGGNFIDTADIYSRWAEGNRAGVSERIIGRWMKERGNRDSLVIATKVRGAMGDGPNDQGLSRRHIMDAVEASLSRLQTDYIDLYQAHSDDRETPLDETLGAFDDLVRQGKVRYIGASNYAAWRLTRALWESDRHGYARYDSLQPHYNLAYRDEFERELEPLCLEQGLGVIPYSPLAGGFLTGKYRRDRELPRSRRAEGIKRRYLNERGFALLDEVDKVAAAHNATTGRPGSRQYSEGRGGPCPAAISRTRPRSHAVSSLSTTVRSSDSPSNPKNGHHASDWSNLFRHATADAGLPRDV